MSTEIRLTYGRRGACSLTVSDERLVGRFVPPPAIDDVREQVVRALETPTEYPPLRQAVVAGDQVTIVVDRHTPQADQLVLGVWQVLEACGVNAADVILLIPATLTMAPVADPRRSLPTAAREAMRMVLHDPTDEKAFGYLATTTGGERVYLSKTLLDADLMLVIGDVAFDPLLGYRGGGSVLYPGLSNIEAMRKTVGQGHDELAPGDSRPLRQIVDEITWLLGLQFAVQVVPASGDRVSRVIAGQIDAAFREASADLLQHWSYQADVRTPVVVVAVDHDARGHDWTQIGAALEVGRALVSREGRVIVLSELRSDLTPGVQLLREVRSPRDALRPLRKLQSGDMQAATQIARALDWSGVSLLSGLPGDLVEELGMLPVDANEELERLIESEEALTIIASAQHVSVIRPDKAE
ncbi:MAG: DUF2088 domain-containing protein [Planctomycetota bacterium]|nr:MAG: DUF2088 domain-containing protein [Planctomycetota bacterium]